MYFMVFFFDPRDFCFPFMKSRTPWNVKNSLHRIRHLSFKQGICNWKGTENNKKKELFKSLLPKTSKLKKQTNMNSCNRRILLLQVFGLGYGNPVWSIIWTQVSCYKKYNIHQPPDAKTSESQQFSYTSATLTQTKSIHAKESK